MPSPSTGELGTANSEAGLLVPMFGAGGHKYAQTLSGQLSFTGTIITAITHIFKQVSVSLYRAVFRAIQGWSELPTVIIGDHPVSYWRLGDNSSVTVFDSSGFLNLGTGHGGITVSQSGALNDSSTAMKFDGSTGYISVGNYGGLKSSINPWTLEALVNTTGANGSIVGVGNDSGGMSIAVSSGAGAGVGLVAQIIFHGINWFGSYTLTSGAWTHLVATFDGTNWRLYANAVLKNSGVNTPLTLAGNETDIGHEPAFAGRYFNGFIQEVAIYPYALTSQQVTTHYNAVTPFPPAGMFTVIRTMQ